MMNHVVSNKFEMMSHLAFNEVDMMSHVVFSRVEIMNPVVFNKVACVEILKSTNELIRGCLFNSDPNNTYVLGGRAGVGESSCCVQSVVLDPTLPLAGGTRPGHP